MDENGAPREMEAIVAVSFRLSRDPADHRTICLNQTTHPSEGFAPIGTERATKAVPQGPKTDTWSGIQFALPGGVREEPMPESRVRDYMTIDPITLHDDDPLREAVELVVVRRIRHIPVLDRRERLVGIVTDRDIKRTLPSPLSSAAREEYEALLETTALSQVMTPQVITVEADAPVSEAVQIIVGNRIGGMPVVEAGVLVGLFTESDALRGYVELLKATEAAALTG